MGSSPDCEVIVVGAGPAGAAVAAMLGEAGVATVLLDRGRFPRDKACGEGLMPAGVDVLRSLGVPVDAMPALEGVTYRVPGAGSAVGMFSHGRTGRGARRLTFDQALAERAAGAPNVIAHFGCAAQGVISQPEGVVVRTDGGDLRARHLIGADGLRSRVARWMGWARSSRRPGRFALVGHTASPGHELRRVVVTLLDGREVYTAPTSPDELLVAVLGAKAGLRHEGERVRDAYARHVREAHPELCVEDVDVRGAGPFWIRPSQVAGRGVFLLGDAGGFLDPLTGDGMSDALVAANNLARLLASRKPDAAGAYRAWERTQWRRRVFVSRLALALTGTPFLARRALRSLQRRPATLNRLLEVNDGSRNLWSLTPRDWAALAGV